MSSVHGSGPFDTSRVRRWNEIEDERRKQLKFTHMRAQRETCHARNYFLDFRKLEWDRWVLAPPGYNLNYCSGECPRTLSRHFSATNHAIIQNIVMRLKRNRHIPPLCCIPVDFKPLSFFYMDSRGDLLFQDFPDMIATSCGCR